MLEAEVPLGSPFKASKGSLVSFLPCMDPDWDPCDTAGIGHLCVGIGMNQDLVLLFLHNWKQLNEQC